MRIATAVLTAMAVALSACGSGNDSGPPAITAAAAKASVERSARIQLTTAGKDRQAVVVFLLDDAEVADEVGDMVRGSVPEPSRLIVNRNVMVVYAAAGKDRAAQVEHAVNAL